MWATHLKSKGVADVELANLTALMKHSRRVQDEWYDLTLTSLRAKKACVAINKELDVSILSKC